MAEPETETFDNPHVIFDHVGLLVRDLNAAVSFFSQFGLRVVRQQMIGAAQVETAYLGHDSGALIQLLQPLPGSPLEEEMRVKGEGLHHICFAGRSIADIVALIPGERVPHISEGGRDMLTCFLEQRRFGVNIELAEPNLSIRPDVIPPEAANNAAGSPRTT